jgi:hypothetical protein
MTKLYKIYFWLLHPKAIADKAAEYFFLLAPSLVFEMPISGGKRQWYLFFGAYCMVFFSKNIFCSTEGFRAITFFFCKLFILFTEILLKSRVCLHDTPHYLKAGSQTQKARTARFGLWGEFGSKSEPLICVVHYSKIKGRRAYYNSAHLQLQFR